MPIRKASNQDLDQCLQIARNLPEWFTEKGLSEIDHDTHNLPTYVFKEEVVNLFKATPKEADALVKKGILVPPGNPLSEWWMAMRTLDGQWSNFFVSGTDVPICLDKRYMINQKTGDLREMNDNDKFADGADTMKECMAQFGKAGNSHDKKKSKK